VEGGTYASGQEIAMPKSYPKDGQKYPKSGHRRTPIVVRISSVVSALLLAAAAAAAAFIAGYSLAFSKVANVYAETSVLEAKAQELEAEILHLRNYAVLIDAIATQGEAALELQDLPRFLPAAEILPSDSGIDEAGSHEVSPLE
jgi:hypothetical protein